MKVLLFLFFFSVFSSVAGACDSYQQCREQFLKATEQIRPKNVIVQLTQIPVEPSAENLFVDTFFLIPQKVERVLILTSGVHGVEGFVGSQQQTDFLNEFLPQLAPLWPHENTAFLLIHALNPWGFEHHRRTTHENVDLNRNFVLEANDYQFKNESYTALNDFLNPTSPARAGLWSHIDFFLGSLWRVIQNGLAPLRKAILLGQYQHEKGVFFGGRQPSPQQEILKRTLDQFFELLPKESRFRVMAVDLHTGYGKRGQLHLLTNSADEQTKNIALVLGNKKLQQVFGADQLDSGQKKEFYDVKGGVLSWMSEQLVRRPEVGLFSSVTFEAGTLDSQKFFGSLDSLYRMRLENQLNFNGAASPPDADVIHHDFMEMFNPSDREWQHTIREQFTLRLIQIFKSL